MQKTNRLIRTPVTLGESLIEPLKADSEVSASEGSVQ